MNAAAGAGQPTKAAQPLRWPRPCQAQAAVLGLLADGRLANSWRPLAKCASAARRQAPRTNSLGPMKLRFAPLSSAGRALWKRRRVKAVLCDDWLWAQWARYAGERLGALA